MKSQFVTSREIQDDNLKSQFVTSSWGGKRKMPYAFTEQGIYMLATVYFLVTWMQGRSVND